MNESSKALFQTAAKICVRMTMQGRQGSAQIVSAEENQQLHFPAWGWLPPWHGAGKTSFDLQHCLQGKRGLLLPHQTSAFPQPAISITIP